MFTKFQRTTGKSKMPEIIADNISIVETNEVEGATRLEAEYYNKPSLINKNFIKGEKIIDYVQYGTSEDLNEEFNGYPVLRLNEFDGSFIGAPSKYCNKISNGVFYKLLLKKGDILVCRTNGNPKLVGKSALVMEDANIAFASYLFRVRPKPSVINSTTLSVYLNSRIGRREIERNLMVSNQANFSPAKFRDIKVPLFPAEFQVIIDKIVANAYHNHKRSKLLYSQAESLLLEELGIKNIDRSHEPCYEVNSADTISANRIDAEYYKPKYEKIVNTIKKYFGGFSFVKNEFVQVKDSFLKDNSKFYRYVEIGGIDISYGNIECLNLKGDKLPTNAKIITQGGELIISKVRPTRGAVTIIPEEWKEVICSGAFVVLKENGTIRKEVLNVFLKSIIGKELLGRPVTGTSYPTVDDKDILELPIPLIKQKLQNQIAELLNESYSTYRRAQILLEEAKKKVEEIIEKGQED